MRASERFLRRRARGGERKRSIKLFGPIPIFLLNLRLKRLKRAKRYNVPPTRLCASYSRISRLVIILCLLRVSPFPFPDKNPVSRRKSGKWLISRFAYGTQPRQYPATTPPKRSLSLPFLSPRPVYPSPLPLLFSHSSPHPLSLSRRTSPTMKKKGKEEKEEKRKQPLRV